MRTLFLFCSVLCVLAYFLFCTFHFSLLSDILCPVGLSAQAYDRCEAAPAIRELLTRILNLALQTLETVPQRKEVRMKVSTYLHRMVEVMRAEVLPFLPSAIERLLGNIEGTEVAAVISLCQQLITRFQVRGFFLFVACVVTQAIAGRCGRVCVCCAAADRAARVLAAKQRAGGLVDV